MDDAIPDLCTRVFRIEAKWLTANSKVSSYATGFAVAKLPNGKLVLATAKHMLDVPKDVMVDWVVQQYDDHSELVREVRYRTHKGIKGDVPFRTHNEFDVGILIPYNKMADGSPFSPPEEKPLPMIEENLMDGTGTRVAWLGFPAQIQDFIGRPQLRYCEGVITSMVNFKGQHLYIVDGHNTPGFSGGPVFSWDTDRNRFRVTGIVSRYLPAEDFPGFCCFEPVNHVRFYLNWWNSQLETGQMLFA